MTVKETLPLLLSKVIGHMCAISGKLLFYTSMQLTAELNPRFSVLTNVFQLQKSLSLTLPFR